MSTNLFMAWKMIHFQRGRRVLHLTNSQNAHEHHFCFIWQLNFFSSRGILPCFCHHPPLPLSMNLWEKAPKEGLGLVNGGRLHQLLHPNEAALSFTKPQLITLQVISKQDCFGFSAHLSHPQSTRRRWDAWKGRRSEAASFYPRNQPDTHDPDGSNRAKARKGKARTPRQRAEWASPVLSLEEDRSVTKSPRWIHLSLRCVAVLISNRNVFIIIPAQCQNHQVSAISNPLNTAAPFYVEKCVKAQQ